MKSITKRTRIKVERTIASELGFRWWETWFVIESLEREFNFKKTCKRWNYYYFHPKDESKLALFVLKYGNFIGK